MQKNRNIKDTKIIIDVLKTLIYFHNFDYPLTLNQLHNFSHFSKIEISNALKELINRKIVFQFDNYFTLQTQINIINNRLESEKRAKKMLKWAFRIGYFIRLFPYVRGVFLSGSISKNQFKKTDDIDYFIITSPNRLWIARTFLIAFKKVFLLNSKKYFCVNYFKSSNALEIEEKNRFTATELATLIPVYDVELLRKMKDINSWVKDYFPNFSTNTYKQNLIKNGFVKRIIERLLQGKFGDYLEIKCMTITHNHQCEKFKKLKKEDFSLAFKSTRETSKHHPENYQSKIVYLMNSQIKLLNHKHNLKIPLENG